MKAAIQVQLVNFNMDSITRIPQSSITIVSEQVRVCLYLIVQRGTSCDYKLVERMHNASDITVNISHTLYLVGKDQTHKPNITHTYCSYIYSLQLVLENPVLGGTSG